MSRHEGMYWQLASGLCLYVDRGLSKKNFNNCDVNVFSIESCMRCINIILRKSVRFPGEINGDTRNRKNLSNGNRDELHLHTRTNRKMQCTRFITRTKRAPI